MSSFETSYPLEIVHMDFLTIGSKKDPNKDINVLVITDHFTHYMQVFVTSSQTAIVVILTLYKEYFVHYSWLDKLHSNQANQASHAYNCTHCESTDFSPYYLMYRWLPRLPIDIEYGVTQPELIDKSRQSYARKLKAHLNWAFKIAEDVNEKESQ